MARKRGPRIPALRKLDRDKLLAMDDIKTWNDHPIRMWRMEHNCSMEKLAKQLGVSTPTICRWESRERDPSKHHWAIILKVTGITPNQFLSHRIAEQNEKTSY